ncbi:MAG: hypothetical protein BGO08_10095 [Altererythrobacter sp. 66-12]|nr:MAG: hypothetical protein BGO08_10095 [Altererythrobacter sp. 66-12]
MNNPAFRPEPFTEWQAYIWSLERAAYEPQFWWFKTRRYRVQRGEFITSYSELAEFFGWKEKRVRLFLKRMIEAGFWIALRADAGAKSPTVISICNYNEIQFTRRVEGEAGGVGGGNGGTKRRHSEGGESKKGKKNGEMKEKNEAHDAAARWNEEEAEIVAAWNANAEHCPWPKVCSLSPRRQQKLRQRFDEVGLQGLRTAIRQAGNSAWLGGPECPRWFRFDALLDPEKLHKLISGEYDDLHPRADKNGG